jgi:hypothetical protein
MRNEAKWSLFMFERSKAAIALEGRLNQGNMGDVLNPAEVEAITGLPSCGSSSEGYRVFHRIARKVERMTDGDLCWRWIKDEQVYRCLSNEEKPVDVSERTDRIKRAAVRNVRIFKTVDIDKLSPAMRMTAIARGATNAAIAMLSSRRTVRQLATSAAKIEPPDEKTLIELMKSRSGVQ